MTISTLWVIDFLRYIVDVGLLCILFSAGYRKRERFIPKTVVLIIFGFILCICGKIWYGAALGKVIRHGSYVVLTHLLLVWLLLCYQEKLQDAFFILTSSVMTKQAAWKLYNVLLLLIQSSECAELTEAFIRGRPLWYICWYVLFLPFAAGIYFFVEKPNLGYRISIAPQVIVISIIIMSSNLLINNIEFLLDDMSFIRVKISLYFCGALYSLMVVFLKYVLISQAKAQKEAYIVNELWKENLEQYEQLRESVEIIQVKCHDVRHQIHRLKERNVDDAWIKELSDQISIYDSEMRTGNEALDVILTDKQLRCQSREISLIMNVDGASLNFMHPADLYSLFGNAIDNAIEYVSTLEKEKRFITLSVIPKGEMVMIHLENYFEGKLEIQDGIPVSQKQDRMNHGYGMLSMKMLAHRYGGWINVFLRDNLFCLDLLVMRPKAE